jgi:plasmid stability protein
MTIKAMTGIVSLTVRNIPKPVLERLRARATRHRRSMQGEVLAILEAAAAEAPVKRSATEILQRVRSLGVATPEEALEMIRVDRDGR